MATYNFSYYLGAVLKRPRCQRRLEQICFTDTNSTFSDLVRALMSYSLVLQLLSKVLLSELLYSDWPC